MKKALALLIILLSFVIISCTSAPYSRWSSSAEKVVDLINHPGEEYLEEITSNPFLLDGEIIVLDSDISMIWNNLNRSRFSFRNGVIRESLPLVAEDYSLFADTMEVKTFFSKYLPDDASLVKVEAGQRSLLPYSGQQQVCVLLTRRLILTDLLKTAGSGSRT